MDLNKKFSDNIFKDYNPEDVLDRNAIEYHAMTGEHTEILGQFLDFTAMDTEQLKECLIAGYLNMNKSKLIK